MAKKKKNELVEKDGQVVKKKGKPRGGNNILTEAALNVQPGDNAKYIHIGMELFNLPKIDLNDPQAVEKRLSEYFAIYAKYDTKPTVAGMAQALGTNRHMLWSLVNDKPINSSGTMPKVPKECANLVKKAYVFMSQLWEEYMLNGKINPVSGIFLGKNHFGYQDKTEYVVTPNVQQESDFSEEDIRRRYLTDSTTIEGTMEE